jgi:hypothetical protein
MITEYNGAVAVPKISSTFPTSYLLSRYKGLLNFGIVFVYVAKEFIIQF